MGVSLISMISAVRMMRGTPDEISGYSASRLDQFVSSVRFDPNAVNSSFNMGARVLTIRGNVGTGTYIKGPYNEFKAINEAIHEVFHAIRRHNYVREHGSLDGAERIFGINKIDPRYKAEEVLVERAAQERMLSIAKPRIAAERKYGSAARADELQSLLDDALADSNLLVKDWGG